MEADKTEDSFRLTGDIGGTNVRFELRNGLKQVLLQRQFLTASVESLEAALKSVLQDCDRLVSADRIEACLCLAGVIKDNKAKALANYGWPPFDGDSIRTKLGRLDSSRSQGSQAAERFRGMCLRSAGP